MGRPRRDSIGSIQRRFINSIVSRNTHRDVRLDESVNTLTPRQLENSLLDRFGEVRTGLHLQFQKGEVTSDSRGTGSLQKIQDDE